MSNLSSGWGKKEISAPLLRAAAPIVRVHTAAPIVVLDLRFFFLLSITLFLAWGCVLIIHFLVTAHENTNVVGRRVSADDSM